MPDPAARISGSWTRAAVARAVAESLEPRRLLCGGWDSGARVQALSAEPPPRAAASLPSGLPLLHSLPGAPAAIFLDFDGDGRDYSPYDTDGDGASFSAEELDVIARLWRHVASDFSMFNVDVTTQQPRTVPYSYSMISNSVTGGSGNVGWFPSEGSPINIHSSFEARNRPTALAHEIGHSFRLQHQSYYDNYGNKVLEYNPGYDSLHGPVMGNDTAQQLNKWFIGHPSSSPVSLQDDVAVMAAVLAPYSNGGDGYRPDDDAGAVADLVADDRGHFRASGIIERLTDADAFSFEAAGGAVRLSVDPPLPSMLDAKLELHSPDGTLLAAADGAPNDQRLELVLPAGRYVAVVSSHGDYGDLGPYELLIGPGEPRPEDPFDASLPVPLAPSLSASASGVNVAWAQVPGASGYVVERSADGAAWGNAGTTGAETTSFADAPGLGGHRYFYRVRALRGEARSAPSPAASVVTCPAAPAQLSASDVRSTLVLNWRDVAGESGYRVERLVEGGPAADAHWIVVARCAANVPSATDYAADSGTRYWYRVIPESPSGDGAPAELSFTTALTAVFGLRVGQVSATSVSLVWDPIVDAAQYRVERSADGVAFEPLGTAQAASYRDDAAAPARQYSYRVIGVNTSGESANSDVVTAVTAGTPLPPEWSRGDVGIVPGSLAAAAPAAYLDDAAAFNLMGAGEGLERRGGEGTTYDVIRTVYRGLSGNGSITARLAWQDTNPLGLAGIMMRERSDTGSPYVFVGASPGRGVGYLSRQSPYARSSGFVHVGDARPAWLRIVRSGQWVSAQVLDGTHWRTVTSEPIAITYMQAALVVTSGEAGKLAAATFDNVTVAEEGPVLADLPAPSSGLLEGNRVNLRALATDAAGDDQLTYTWSADSVPPGAAPPQFSPNRTNAAKNVTATFSAAGRYVIRVSVANALGRSVTATVPVDVAQVPSRVRIAPWYGPVRAGASVPIAATVTDQFGAPIVRPPLQWAAWYGTVDATGTYTAPEFAYWEQVSVSVPSAEGVSGTMDVYVYDDSAVALLSAVSRKTHGRRGVADLPLVLYGAPAVVEPRRGGPTTLVFTFSGPVAPFDGVLGADDFSLTNAAFRSARIAGNVLTLELGGVVDGRVVSVGLSGIGDTHGGGLADDADVDVRALYGDADRDGAVTRADVASLRARLLRPPSTADLLCDIDLSGAVTAADLSLARRRLGRSVE